MFGLERIPTYHFGFRTQYRPCGEQQLHILELENSVPVRQHFALTSTSSRRFIAPLRRAARSIP
jgi:hypothetical protein